MSLVLMCAGLVLPVFSPLSSRWIPRDSSSTLSVIGLLCVVLTFALELLSGDPWSSSCIIAAVTLLWVLIVCQGRSKFGPLRRSKSRPVGEGVAVFVGRLERSLRSPFRAAQA